MGVGITMKSPHDTILKKIKHYLFECPTFWSIKPKYNCHSCGVGYRCYWEANDACGWVSVCNKCTMILESYTKENQ